jgi:hypothetical protein
MIENQKAPLSADRNRHIKEYLSYYLAPIIRESWRLAM